MLTTRLISRAAPAVVALALSCVPAAFAQDTPKPAVEEVYLARDNGEGKAGEQVTEFGTNDVPIHCVVLLDTIGKATVKMNFVAVAVAGVKPETKVVTASYTTTERQNQVNFTGRPDGKWTPGRYRVDIFVDGKPQRQLEFSIKGSTPATPAATKFAPPAAKPKTRPKN